jgi:DNA-binding NarL/FixJ family response regulator
VAEAIRVLLVDDHAVVREGLRAFLSLQDGVEIVGEAADGEAGLREAERLRPDVVLMDLVMPRLDGVGAMRELRRRLPATRVIVLTSFLDDERLLPAIRRGPPGYLLKDVEPQVLAQAVRTRPCGQGAPGSHGGRPPGRVHRPAAGAEPRGGLTPREEEVLDLIRRGLPNKRIARELAISEKTVKAHVSHVLEKLGVTDRTQAALHAERAGRERAQR